MAEWPTLVWFILWQPYYVSKIMHYFSGYSTQGSIFLGMSSEREQQDLLAPRCSPQC